MSKSLRRISVFATLFILVALPRLYRFNAPIADWHSWRQADTAAVARNFTKFGFDLLRPRYDDLSNVQSGFDNPQGYRMVEFPLYQAAAAGLREAVGIGTVQWWLRALAVAASAGTGLLLFLLIRKYDGLLTGAVALLLYALLPYGVFFGRTILPDGIALFFAVLSVYLLDRNRKGPGFWLSAVAGALALLVKPTAAFVLVPSAILLFRPGGRRFRWAVRVVGYGILVLFPLWWWRTWIVRFPEGIPVSEWLLNGGNIRFTGAWLYWLFAERIAKLMLGYWGVAFLALGAATLWFRRKDVVVGGLTAGMLVYFTVFARGNVQHDYYQILVFPAVVYLAARGFAQLLEMRGFPPVTRGAVALAVTAFSFAFSWYTIRTYYWINNGVIVTAGQAADKLLPPDAKVIAPYGGDTAFLYQTNRQGWPVGFSIEDKIAKGATHYVSVNPPDPEAVDLAQRYTVVELTDTYVIIDLRLPAGVAK